MAECKLMENQKNTSQPCPYKETCERRVSRYFFSAFCLAGWRNCSTYRERTPKKKPKGWEAEWEETRRPEK